MGMKKTLKKKPFCFFLLAFASFSVAAHVPAAFPRPGQKIIDTMSNDEDRDGQRLQAPCFSPFRLEGSNLEREKRRE